MHHDDDEQGRPTESGKRVPGRLMRTLKTSTMGSAVGSSYLGGKLFDRFRSKEGRREAREERHRKNATRVLETMRELRGPIMKVGQLLSTHREILPESYTELLTSLQSKAPPMPYEDVRRIVEEELGAPPEAIFARFEREAHAAASIGQVHRAWLADGTALAVKVQYPGAESMVDSDLKNLELGMKLVKSIGADVMRNKKMDLSPIYEEIAEHIRQETDLCREAFNAQLMAEVFAGHPDIIVPRVFLEHSGLRVITYEFIEGRDIGSFCDRDWKEGEHQGARERIAQLLTDAFWLQLTRQGVLHADPHPGNYFVVGDLDAPQSLKLALLDYGCIKIFDPDVVDGFVDLTRAWLAEDDDAIHAALSKLDMFDDPDSREEFEDLRIIGGYFCTGLDSDLYSFAEDSYAKRGREVIEYFVKRRRIPKAQREFIFLSRVILGYFEYFSRLRLAMNFRAVALPHIERGWQGRTVDIPDFYQPA